MFANLLYSRINFVKTGTRERIDMGDTNFYKSCVNIYAMYLYRCHRSITNFTSQAEKING